jgi:hypothetical protein
MSGINQVFSYDLAPNCQLTYGLLNLGETSAGMKRWGLRGASVSHDKKHDTGANATQPPNPQCFIPVVGCWPLFTIVFQFSLMCHFQI